METTTMQTILLIAFIIVVIGTLIGGIIIGIMLITKQRTVVRVVSKNNRFIKKVFRGVMEETFEVSGKTYHYDNAGEIRNFWGAHIYYLENNPHPLIFDHEAHKFVTNAKDLKHIYKNNLIAQLLTGDMTTKILLVLVIVVLFAVLANIGIPFLTDNSCTLANNNATIGVIQDAVSKAFK